MDMIDALWYGAVAPGEVLEKRDEKQKALARLFERNRAELAALHPEAGAILEKLAGNQAELWQLAVLGQEYTSRFAKNCSRPSPSRCPSTKVNNLSR